MKLYLMSRARCLRIIFVPYERSLIRATSQQVNKTVEQFITCLLERAVYCELSAAQDEMIRDQVIEKCLSHRQRRKLLEM